MLKSITRRDTASLDVYFAEIARQRLLEPEEEETLAKKAKAGDTAALDKLVCANLRFVVSVAKQYQHRGLSLSDLINEGNIGLIKAAKRFDETKGFKFISYVVWWIRQSILHALNMESATIRIPSNRIGAINKLNKAYSALEQKYERAPTAEELSQMMDISPRELHKTINTPGKMLSLDAPVVAFSEARILSESIHNPDSPSPDEGLMKESLSRDVEHALSKLSDKESSILKMFYGIGAKHEFNLDEIGYHYNLSKERVRQIKERAIKKLRQWKGKRVLQESLEMG